MLSIALIDDNPDDRTLIIRELNRALPDLQVTEISSPAQLDAMLLRDSYDVVITDYQLGWNDGLTILQALKESMPDVPVIMFTATGTEEIAVEAMKSGLDDYVVKSPKHYVRLPAAVQRALERAEMRRAAAQFAAEREVMLQREQAARSEAEAALRLRDEFLSLAAHELKTPLTALFGHVQLLERRFSRDSAYEQRDQRTVEVVVQQAARLNKLVAALLSVSRIQAGQLVLDRRPVELCLLARRVCDELQPLLIQHTLTCECPDKPLIVEGDEMRLEQVLINLLQNAIKYSPAGGPIAMCVDRQGDNALISVADQGLGIPEEALPQLFQRFYRGPNADAEHLSGMGIGLYVVREVITRHGGDVSVVSKEGAGSTFTVCLPLHKRVRKRSNA